MTTQTNEIPREFREFADKGVSQARTAFGSLMTGAVKASEQMQSTATTFQTMLHAAVLKGLDHAQSNADATFDHAQKLSRSRDLKEAFELQSEFVKERFNALQAQVREFGALGNRAAH